MRLREEINKFSSDDEKPILNWLLDRYSLESQGSFVARCEMKRYGKYSYQCNRIWAPTIEGIAIFNQLKKRGE